MSVVCKFAVGNEVNNDMYKAIYLGDITKVSNIIDCYGLCYCPKWEEGQDLLLTAVEGQHSEIVKLLLRKGCKIEYDEDKNTIPDTVRLTLTLAVNKGDCDLINLVLGGFKDPKTKTKVIDTLDLLHIAVNYKQREIVELLLEHGGDFECKTKGGELTPLHIAAAVKENDEIVELLLKAGCNIESKDANENTGLSLAVSVGNSSVVKIFLKNGANCNCKNKNGSSPLIDAISKSYLQIVEDLLAFGAEVNDKNTLGFTPLHVACMLKNKQLISMLLDAGADVNATDRFGSVPCDIIFKKLSPGTIFFENPSLSYFLAKQLAILKTGGFYLNKKNEALYDRFCSMYCHDITVSDLVLSPSSYVMASTMKSCEEEISKMKSMKSSGGFTVHDIFSKMKDPLSVISENEIMFLKSIDLKEQLPMYESIIRNTLKKVKLRNELIASGQEWFSFLNQNREDEVTLLPEEMRIHVVSFLGNEDIEQLIQCGEEVCRHKSSK